MGEHERLLPNGLLPDEAASVIRVLDLERWLKAEERTAELISCIQPNGPSEERRNAVADYVQRLISKCFPCEVFTFGSVPLKTYLPDGDIDVTAFSKNQNLKETWAHQVRDILEIEEKNENAEFRVKEVQYIQAEVKIIKCLVENIVVDISFNQLGGLCTLCFLEEVDHLINQDHLFKKSIILIKAWCYYESRILGAHHGLISTYALETLVLYIFHVFNNTFAGPLEVLYRFLEFFSKFDWDNFCVSLWGPVPISSLPDVTAEPPRKDSGELLLSKTFLEACSSVYAVGPNFQENHGQHFMSKFFNVIDPLRVNNNLGRSVSKGNFFRIRSAFAFGAKRLARLLDCPEEDIHFEVNQFFMNTWDRHGSGHRPDAPRSELLNTRSPAPELSQRLDKLGSDSNNKSSGHEAPVDVPHDNYMSQKSSRNSEVSVTSRSSSQRTNSKINNRRTIDQSRRANSGSQGLQVEKSQRNFKPDNLVSGEHQGRYLFARTRSSPQLTDMYGELSFQGRRNGTIETGKGQTSSSTLDNSRRKNLQSENSGNHIVKSSTDDPSSVKHTSRQNLDATVELSSISGSYHDDSSMCVTEEFSSSLGAQGMHQEEQDFVNIMASSAGLGFNGQVHFPLNPGSNPMPYPISPSVLASMGYAPQRGLGPMAPAGIPLIENLWGANMQFPQGLVSSPFSHYFPGMGMTTSTADSVEPGNENFGSPEANAIEVEHEFWHESERGSTRGFDIENGGVEMHQTDEKHQSSSASHNFVSSSRISGSSMRSQQKYSNDHAEVLIDDRLRPSSSLNSRTSSENSWEGSSAKTSKSSREKKNRKTASAVTSTGYGKGKNSSEHSAHQIDDESKDWNSAPSTGTEMTERSPRPLAANTTLHVPRDQLPGFGTSQASGSESLLPVGAPMILGANSRQRTADDSGVLPFTFYQAGPPVPFVMVPMYNVPTDPGNSDASTSQFRVEEVVDTGDSVQNFESAERLDQSEALSASSSMMRVACGEPLEHKSDILHSDFASHWQNLQFGRFCQTPRYSSPLVYGPSLVVPPVYLQGRFPWDGPGRPVSANMNVFTQLMSYGPRIVPAAPLQSVSNRPAGVYQHYADELPRYRSGTGTYLPNPKISTRERHSTNSRKGSYSYDRNDQHGDGEGNWGTNSKPRTSNRSHSRSQVEKSSSRLDRLASNETRSDRPWTSHRHDTISSHNSQNGPVRPNASQTSSANVAYGMYPLPSVNHGGVSSNGPAFPPLVMLYPYDHRGGLGGPSEQLEFGSLGPVGFSGMNEVSHLSEGSRLNVGFEDHRFHGSSTHQSSPDQPASPLLHR